MPNNQFLEPEIWAASIVDILLWELIDLWKEQSEVIHDDNNLQEKQFTLQKLKDQVQELCDKHITSAVLAIQFYFQLHQMNSSKVVKQQHLNVG